MNNTIVAVSTGNLSTPIAVIRLSGPAAFEIVDKMINSNINDIKHSTMKVTDINDGSKVIDNVIIKKFDAPNTFTGENIIEIDCHGGQFVKEKIIETCIKHGARMAEPGEFTKKAYLNGKIDLVNAEAIHDLIDAKTSVAQQIAVNSLKGSTSKLVADLREDLIQLTSHIEVNIDYPEYDDVEELTATKLLPLTKKMNEKIKAVLKDARIAKIAKDGINIAIIGKPNVGKSSLLNCLIDQDKAIVTDIKGTTRDIVEGSISINGVAANFIDTAGIRDTEDVVEKLGIEKSISMAHDADITIVLLDGSNNLDSEDQKIIDLTKDMNRLIVANKNDINKNEEYISISAKEKDVTNLIAALEEKFNITDNIINSGQLSNARQIGLLEEVSVAIDEAVTGLENNKPTDLISVDLKDAWTKLGEITGLEVKEDFLDELFSRFCLGK